MTRRRKLTFATLRVHDAHDASGTTRSPCGPPLRSSLQAEAIAARLVEQRDRLKC
jgi:hypothetical protein